MITVVRQVVNSKKQNHKLAIAGDRTKENSKTLLISSYMGNKSVLPDTNDEERGGILLTFIVRYIYMYLD